MSIRLVLGMCGAMVTIMQGCTPSLLLVTPRAIISPSYHHRSLSSLLTSASIPSFSFIPLPRLVFLVVSPPLLVSLVHSCSPPSSIIIITSIVFILISLPSSVCSCIGLLWSDWPPCECEFVVSPRVHIPYHPITSRRLPLSMAIPPPLPFSLHRSVHFHYLPISHYELT